MPNLNDVKQFWNNNLLWSGESEFELGSLEFFEEHRSVVIEDCFADNLIGKNYTKSSFVKILEPHFLIKETYLHFFPVRVLPFKILVFIHKWLDIIFGFMIYANVKKK